MKETTIQIHHLPLLINSGDMADILSQCKDLLTELMEMDTADILTDLKGTGLNSVKSKLEYQQYSSIDDFAKDMRLVFDDITQHLSPDATNIKNLYILQ